MARRDGSDGLAEAEAVAREVGRLIGSAVPEGYGFAVLVFSFGPGGATTYVSNADRADMIRALRECADRLEARKDTPAGEPFVREH